MSHGPGKCRVCGTPREHLQACSNCQMVEFSAHDLGSCIRAIVAARLGMKRLPAPAWAEKMFSGGYDHEDRCIEMMESDGWIIEDHQREISIPITDNLRVIGHLDGTGRNDPTADTRVLEVKSPGTWRTFEKAYKTGDWSDPLANRYGWAISVYMVATGLEAVVACLDGETVRTFGIEVPIHDMKTIAARVQAIEYAAQQGFLPHKCSQSDGDSCPFRWIHDESQVTQIDNPELAENLRIYTRLTAQAADLTKTAKKMRPDLDAAFTDLGVFNVNGVRTTVYEQANPASWDEDALVAKYGEEVREFKKQGKGRRMKVTEDG